MKKNIAIISGGYSGEYEISVQSGQVVKSYLDPSKYRTFSIRIKADSWTYSDVEGKDHAIDKNDFSLQLPGEKIIFDAVFIAIHGTPGEDGKIQGYFDLLKIPYTTCDAATSALTFNKHFCKQVVRAAGVNSARSIFLTKSIGLKSNEILNRLKLPLFVKPNNGGSSVGMSKINTAIELEPAFDKAFAEDDQVLVEEFIAGREITCGVFRFKGKITSLPVIEIITQKDWFDYEAKYDESLTDEICPANIPPEIYNACQKTSSFLYEQLNCKGIVRFDYIYTDEEMYFLEVNTVPGLTESSLIPKMAAHIGLKLSDLFDMLLEEASF